MSHTVSNPFDHCVVCSSGETPSDPADVEGHAILHSLGSYIAPAVVHYASRGLSDSDLINDLGILVRGTGRVVRAGIVPVPYYVTYAVTLSFWLIYWYEKFYFVLFRRHP